MNTVEKNAMEVLKGIIPKLTEDAKQYILGYGEGYVAATESKQTKEEQKEKSDNKEEDKS